MNNSKSLNEFVSMCHRHFACFTLAKMGLEKISDHLRPSMLGSKQRLFLGNTNPNEGKPAQAVIPFKEAVDSAAKNGSFHDQLAKLILVNIYTEWDELYRPAIAREFNVEPKQVKSDLMGDIRIIRNCIIHNKSKISKDFNKLKIIEINKKEEDLKLSEEFLSSVMDKINKIAISVESLQNNG